MKIEVIKEYDIDPQINEVTIEVVDSWDDPTSHAYVNIIVPFKCDKRLTNVELRKIFVGSNVEVFIKSVIAKVIHDNWGNITKQLNNRVIDYDEGNIWLYASGKNLTANVDLADLAVMLPNPEKYITSLKFRI